MPKPVSNDQLLVQERLGKLTYFAPFSADAIIVRDPRSKEPQMFAREQLIRIAQQGRAASSGELTDLSQINLVHGFNFVGRAINADPVVGGAVLWEGKKDTFIIPDARLWTIDDIAPAKAATKDLVLTAAERAQFEEMKESVLDGALRRGRGEKRAFGRTQAFKMGKTEEKKKADEWWGEFQMQKKKAKIVHASAAASPSGISSTTATHAPSSSATPSSSSAIPSSSSAIPSSSKDADVDLMDYEDDGTKKAAAVKLNPKASAFKPV